MSVQPHRKPRAEFVYIDGEVWRVVPGHASYEVSDLGRLRRLAHVRRRAHPKTGLVQDFRYAPRILRPVKTQYGYQQVNLDGRLMFLHRVVLTAFVGARPADCEACHGNGIRDDNRLGNLRWDTKKANQRDMDRHGTRRRGEAHPFAKYPNAVVAAIKRGTISKEEAAAAHGIKPTYYDKILRGEARREPT